MTVIPEIASFDGGGAGGLCLLYDIKVLLNLTLIHTNERW